MKKLFLILMLFLLPFQYTWAMVTNYDTHDAEGSQAHFGHHGHQTSENHHDATDLADDNESGTHTSINHDHFGFLHISCGEVLSHDLPIFVPESKQFSIQYFFNPHPPPANALERPNWVAAV
jgi:hypothetical protein